MWQFFKYTLASFLALFLFFGFLFTLILAVASISATQEKNNKLDAPAVLKLDFDQPMFETGVEDPLEGLDLPFAQVDRGIGLNEIVEAIRNASLDPNIKAIYIHSNGFSGGMGMAEELRKEIQAFKKTGKPVVAFGEFFSESLYYLLSVADKVYLHPNGGMEFNGANMEVLFFKGSLEKLNIRAEVFKVGQYKSAIEPFERSSMSEENREQVSHLLERAYGHFLDSTSSGRGMDRSELKNISDQMLVGLAGQALDKKLIDGILYEDEAFDALKELVGLPDKDELKLLTVKGYQGYESFIEKPDTRDRIAILVAQGEIRGGESEEGLVGSRTLVQELERLKENKRVKAIVLRVNSPGGGGLASDAIWNAIQKVRKEKPVVASMSDLAASGGYYLSMGCDYIYAHPNTITGSIGVFGLFLDMTDFFDKKLGITRDLVKTGAYSDIFSPFHHFTDPERALIQSYADDFYENFTQKAAKGRNMDIEKLKELAGGRVWTGSDAVELGLVDELGGLDEAIHKAAELAEVETYRVYFYPKRKSFLEEIFKDMGADSSIRFLKSEFGPLWDLIRFSELEKRQMGLWARLPIGTTIHY